MEWSRNRANGLKDVSGVDSGISPSVTITPIYRRIQDHGEDLSALDESKTFQRIREGEEEEIEIKCSDDEKEEQEDPVDLSMKLKNVANTWSLLSSCNRSGRGDKIIHQPVDLGPVDLSKPSLDWNLNNPSALQVVSVLNDIPGAISHRKEHKCDFAGCDKV